MHRLRDPHWFLILTFLLIIGSVPLIQMVIELKQEDGIRAFDLFHEAPTAANLRSYERTLEAANWAARLSRPWAQFGQFKWLKDGGEKAVIGQSGWYFYKPGLSYMLARHDETKSVNATNDPVTAIVDFRNQLSERGIHLVVMPVPNKESVYPDLLTPRASTLRGVMAPRTRELIKRLHAADVEVVDLFKTFHEAREQSSSSAQAPLYLAQDTHWSPEGLKLAARTAARRLSELGWARSGQVDYSERPALAHRLGDIVRMLQVPQIERSVTPENVPCTQVIRRDNGELYKDAPDGEILVLGDSFMRIYQQDDPRAAGFISHLAKELKQPVKSLVNDGGGSTLVRQELRSRPAFLKNTKVVIWEFVERDIGLGIEGWKLIRLPAAAPPESTRPVSDNGNTDGEGTGRQSAGSTNFQPFAQAASASIEYE